MGVGGQRPENVACTQGCTLLHYSAVTKTTWASLSEPPTSYLMRLYVYVLDMVCLTYSIPIYLIVMS